MDELEDVVILNSHHSSAIIDANVASKSNRRNGKKRSREDDITDHVLITGGIKGILRVFTVSNCVSNCITAYILYILTCNNFFSCVDT